MSSISAIIVGYSEEPSVIQKAIESLRSQSTPPDEIILVDNSHDSYLTNLAQKEGVEYLPLKANVGFPQGVSKAAQISTSDYIFLLNPDAEAESDLLFILKDTLDKNPRAAAAGGQIILPDGKVNAGDNPIHITGLAWSGNYLGVPEKGIPRSARSLSGAAVLIRRDLFVSLGFFHPAIFMYQDDSDFSWRSKIAGYDTLFCPEARVIHEYEFNKGKVKWQWLEEARLASVLTNYEKKTLFLLAPALIATEVAIVIYSIKTGWFSYKLRSWKSVFQRRRKIKEMRKKVSDFRVVSDKEMIQRLETKIDSPILDSGPVRLAGPLFSLYRALIRLFL